MGNISNFSNVQDRINALEDELDKLRAYIDQRFDESSDMLDDITARINNLR